MFCPIDGSRIHKLSPEEMVNIIIDKAKELKEPTVTILSPVVRGQKGGILSTALRYAGAWIRRSQNRRRNKNLHEK